MEWVGGGVFRVIRDLCLRLLRNQDDLARSLSTFWVDLVGRRSLRTHGVLSCRTSVYSQCRPNASHPAPMSKPHVVMSRGEFTMADSWTNEIVVTSVREGRVSLAARKVSSCRPVEIVLRASASTGRNLVTAVRRCLEALGFNWDHAETVDIVNAMPEAAAGIRTATLEFLRQSE